MDDDDRIPPHELEQLARSLSLDGSLGRHDAPVAAQACDGWRGSRRSLI
jgi:hypothetical protein